MWRWLPILGFLVLAACQQPPAPGPASASSQSSLSGRPDSGSLPFTWNELGTASHPTSKYFAAEAEKIGSRIALALVRDCYRQLQDRAAFDRCLRKDLVAKFDASGEGEDKCARQTDLDAYASCVIVGNVSIDLVRRLDSGVRIEDDMWDSPRAFAELIDKVAISNAIVACRSEKTELGATHCAFDWMLSRVDLPERLSKRCSADLVSRERTACLGEAVTIRFIEEHLSQAEGTSI